MRNSADQDLIEAIVRRGVEVGVRTAMAQIRSDLAGVSKRHPIVPPSMDSQPQIEQSLDPQSQADRYFERVEESVRDLTAGEFDLTR